MPLIGWNRGSLKYSLGFDVPLMNNTYYCQDSWGGGRKHTQQPYSCYACLDVILKLAELKAEKLNWRVAKSRTMFEGLVGQLDRGGDGFLQLVQASSRLSMVEGLEDKPVRVLFFAIKQLSSEPAQTRPFWVGVAACDVKPSYVFGGCYVIDNLLLGFRPFWERCFWCFKKRTI